MPWMGRKTLLGSGSGIPASGGLYLLDDSLAYMDTDGRSLVTSGGSLFLEGSQGNVHIARPYDRDFLPNTNPDPQTGLTTYISFLMQRLGEPADPTDSIYGGTYPYGDNLYPRAAGMNLFSNDSGDAVPLFVGGVSNATDDVWRLRGQDLDGVNKDPKSEMPFGSGNIVYFVILKIQHGSGDGFADVVKVYLNPQLEAEEVNEPAMEAGWETRDDPLYLPGDWLGFEVGNNSSYRPFAELIVDEFRIGDTWEAVAPIDGDSSPVMEDNYINTGDWLGWLYREDTNWYYSFTLSGWVYSPDAIVSNISNGRWLYIAR
jgi:hypothetical protein